MPESSEKQQRGRQKSQATAEFSLPFNDDYEREFLAELLFTRDRSRFAQILAMTEPYLFYREVHKKLAEWTKVLALEGLTPPLMIHAEETYPWGALAAAVRARDHKLWEEGGRKVLAELWDWFCPNGPVEWLHEQLLKLSVERERMAIYLREIDAVKALGRQLSAEDLEELWRRTEAETRRVTAQRLARTAGGDTAAEAWERLKANRKARSEGRGADLGIPTIDSAMGGLLPGELVCLAARAGVGKTTLAVNVLHRHLEDREQPNDWLAAFSLEMGTEALLQKLLMRATALPQREVGDHTSPFLSRIEEKVAEYKNLRMDGSPTLTVDEILSKTLAWQAAWENRPPKMLVIDHHGRLESATRRREQTLYERASETVREVKRVAKELHTVVLLLVQLSRKAGYGETKPTLDAIRDSGVIEEEADLVLGAWRPKWGRADDDTFSLAVLKARRMEYREVECHWNPKIALVEELHNGEQIPF